MSGSPTYKVNRSKENMAKKIAPPVCKYCDVTPKFKTNFSEVFIWLECRLCGKKTHWGLTKEEALTEWNKINQ